MDVSRTDPEDLNDWLERMENIYPGKHSRRQMSVTREAIKNCGLDIIRSTGVGAPRNHALAHLQSALFWANHSITHQNREEEDVNENDGTETGPEAPESGEASLA
jgi:hypothetical protein